jgi:gamma-glutamylcyclotransferase (GGCT)/AIG2-like uncharacterized protein YtfP
MKLFVYGTLKRGLCRNRHLEGQIFLSLARTAPKYRMFNCGEYPGLVPSLDGLAIEGELWEISDECVRRLDVVEGAPDEYQRGAIELASPHELGAIAYFYQRPTAGLPECGPRW